MSADNPVNSNIENQEVMSPAENAGDVNSVIMPQGPNPIKQSILMRASALHMFFLGMALFAIGVVVWTKFGPEAEKLTEQATQYSFRNEIIEASRGDVLSDDYRTLATSIVFYELRIDLAATGLTDEFFINNVRELSQKLATFFGDKSAAEYQFELTAARTARKRYHRLSNRKVDYLELQQLKQFPILKEAPNIGGFIPQEQERRVNPYGALAGRTIGFVNNVGIKVGIEGAFNDNLKGMDGVTTKQKISGNFWIPISSPYNIEPVNGVDVVSTINIEIQDIVQRALNRRILETEADWGTVIVMDVATGDVKAIANGTRTKDGKVVEDYNYAIGMSLEPGSTFKLAGYLALLDDAKVPSSRLINTEGGKAQVGYAKVVDSRSGGYGTISLREVFEHSSNIGMAKAVMASYSSQPSKFVDYMEKLGLKKELGLQLAGEAKPLIRSPQDKGWDGTTLTMMSYGYALRLAPIHTLSLFNAVANNGRMMKPRFVKELRQKGVRVKEFPSEVVVESIATQGTLKDAQYALEGVVLRGTGRMLKNDMYTVAAKTGTAQIAMGRSGYSTGSGAKHYLGSVAGYFPVEKPRYSFIVALKTFYIPGQDKPYYGGALAGPLFREIADQIYNHDFKLQKPNSLLHPNERKARLVAQGGSADDLNRVVNELGLGYSKALGTMVTIDSGRLVDMVIRNDSLGVPNVRGVALQDALRMLYAKGYDVRVSGMGRIVGQEVFRDSVTGQTRVVLKLK